MTHHASSELHFSAGISSKSPKNGLFWLSGLGSLKNISVDGGIDYFKGDVNVNVSIFAQNFLMVKMAGRSFGRKKLRSDCHRVL